MQQIRNFEEANKVLAQYIPAVRKITGKDITLSRMLPLMKVLGNPEQKLKIIHVAGTSGKTSTSYYISSLLKLAGYKIGLTISPHIECINERVQINLEPVGEEQFCKNLSEFLEIIKNVEPEPTYFELLIAFVYWFFAKEKVDYAVIETGLGGLHDATNVAKRADKVCAITDIGIDHTHVLGNTLQLIATQKAGIIHVSNQTFMYSQSSEIDLVFKIYAEKQGAKLNTLSIQTAGLLVSPNFLENLPSFQQRNWLLSYKTFLHISKRDGLPLLDNDELLASTQTYIPGRMEIKNINGKTVILDGAHNQQKMTALVSSFKAKYPGKKATVLLSLKDDKEYETVLPLVLPICSKLIISAFETSQDFPVRSADIKLIESAAKDAGFNNVTTEKSSKIAFKIMLSSHEPLCLVTGSFYLLSSIMKALND